MCDLVAVGKTLGRQTSMRKEPVTVSTTTGSHTDTLDFYFSVVIFHLTLTKISIRIEMNVVDIIQTPLKSFPKF